MKRIPIRPILSEPVSQWSNCFRFLSTMFTALGICLLAFPFAQAQQADRSDLPITITRKLKKNVIPPLLAGNHAEFQSQLSTIIAKLQPESFEQIEAFGQTSGAGSLYKSFYQAWRKDVEQASVSADVKMRRPIALYLTSSVTKQIEALLAELENHELTSTTKVPENWLESRNFFLDVESLTGRMSEMQIMGHLANSVLQRYRGSGKLLQGEAEEILKRFETAAESFATLAKQTVEKEAVLRLQRLNTAADALRKPSNFETDFVSALFLEEDAAALDFFFKNSDAPDAEELKVAGLFQTTFAMVAGVRNSGNPVVEKAQLLSKGLKAWKRGRYGIGALFNGLLKPSLSPAFVGIPKAAQANAGSLRMPETTLAISQFLGSDSGEGYDRRHYYTWDLEYRPLYRSYSNSSDRSTERNTTPVSDWQTENYTCTDGSRYTRNTRDVEYQDTVTDVKTSYIRRQWAPQDDSIPPRIVGTQEYAAAIAYLEKLSSISGEEEIEVYDKVIAQLPEFIFYSGMTAEVKQLKPFAGNTPIKNLAEAKSEDFADSQYKKQSLAWLMALAKVELNATRSMYVPGINAFIPEDGATFGLLHYYHLLLDDVAAHLQAIETDDQFKKAIKKSVKEASSATVAYLRRLKLINSMLNALEQSGDLMVAQKASGYRKTTDAYNRVLLTQAVNSSKDLKLTSYSVTTGTTARGKQTKR